MFLAICQAEPCEAPLPYETGLQSLMTFYYYPERISSAAFIIKTKLTTPKVSHLETHLVEWSSALSRVSSVPFILVEKTDEEALLTRSQPILLIQLIQKSVVQKKATIINIIVACIHYNQYKKYPILLPLLTTTPFQYS